jgi:hypothetical protein
LAEDYISHLIFSTYANVELKGYKGIHANHFTSTTLFKFRNFVWKILVSVFQVSAKEREEAPNPKKEKNHQTFAKKREREESPNTSPPGFANPRGASALAETLYGAALLLQLGQEWDRSVPPDAADYPLVILLFSAANWIPLFM